MRQRTGNSPDVPASSAGFFGGDSAVNEPLVISDGTAGLKALGGGPSSNGPVLPGGGGSTGSSGGGLGLPIFSSSSSTASSSFSSMFSGAGAVGAPPKIDAFKRQAAMIGGVGFVFFLLSSEGYRYAWFVLTLCCLGLLFAKYLSEWLMAKDDGTPAMREVSNAIREGAGAFLQTQYGAIGRIAVIVAGIIFFSYQLRPSDMTGGVNGLSSFTLGTLAAFSFAVGAISSSIVGYISMIIACRTNIRVTSAARRGYLEALIICFRGGSFSAMLVLACCVMGISILYTILYTFFADSDGTNMTKESIGPGDIPLLCVGFGFGASFVALFMQLGGGIYTKGADVGADMVGKVEQGIPEDDPRNPAVIADLVGGES
jgi:H+-translocating diphosphatase